MKKFESGAFYSSNITKDPNSKLDYTKKGYKKDINKIISDKSGYELAKEFGLNTEEISHESILNTSELANQNDVNKTSLDLGHEFERILGVNNISQDLLERQNTQLSLDSVMKDYDKYQESLTI